MAEKTVREEMAEVLEARGCEYSTAVRPPCIDEQAAKGGWCDICLALARHRAEPECACESGPDCPCYCEGANEGHSMGCNDDSCACWAAGHQAGLEAQRERVGGGRA